MALVRVVVLDSSIINALNRPGRPVSNWRDEVGTRIESAARVLSPVNDVLNAQHRGGVVGTYRAAWSWERGHAGNQHLVRAIITNSSNHAQAVEYGNPGSSEFQVFSWTNWGGATKWVGPATVRNFRRAGPYPRGGSFQKGYDGRHVLRDATNAVVGLAGTGII